jgi:hypothetical protein
MNAMSKIKKNTIHDKYQTPACFGTRVPSWGVSEQRNASPT